MSVPKIGTDFFFLVVYYLQSRKVTLLRFSLKIKTTPFEMALKSQNLPVKEGWPP